MDTGQADVYGVYVQTEAEAASSSEASANVIHIWKQTVHDVHQRADSRHIPSLRTSSGLFSVQRPHEAVLQLSRTHPGESQNGHK